MNQHHFEYYNPVDWFWALSGQTHQTKDWLVRNQDNLPE
jgi:hypothetical protein